MDGKIDLTKMTEAFKVLAAALMEANRITIDYGEITRKTMEVMKDERERIWKDERLVLTQNKAGKIYGYAVIRALVDRGVLEQYQFDERECVDEDGNTFKKAKGVIYYLVRDIEEAIRKGNLLKGTRRGAI